jgi:tRNA(fMet)-specific endonuclease VapC
MNCRLWKITPSTFVSQAGQQGVRIGTMDLKIASIVLVHGGTLLSGNNRDFQQVPGIQVEDWLQS